MKNKKRCTSCRALIIDITGLRQVIDGAMITGLLTLVDVLEQPKRKKKKADQNQQSFNTITFIQEGKNDFNQKWP